jgi:hypothetical protein
MRRTSTLSYYIASSEVRTLCQGSAILATVSLSDTLYTFKITTTWCQILQCTWFEFMKSARISTKSLKNELTKVLLSSIIKKVNLKTNCIENPVAESGHTAQRNRFFLVLG